MIICLRGTNGSGKTTTVLKIMKRYGAVPESVNNRGRANNYKMSLENGEILHVIGCYESVTGGCDGIHEHEEIWSRIVQFAKVGHVLFEGLTVSGFYGRIGKWSEAYGDSMVFAFLDTPVETCIERVKFRRKQRGKIDPLNPKNLIDKYRANHNSLSKIRDVYKRRVEVIDHRNPLPKILGLLYTANEKSP